MHGSESLPRVLEPLSRRALELVVAARQVLQAAIGGVVKEGRQWLGHRRSIARSWVDWRVRVSEKSKPRKPERPKITVPLDPETWKALRHRVVDLGTTIPVHVARLIEADLGGGMRTEGVRVEEGVSADPLEDVVAGILGAQRSF
jgi:hypothetical protein